MRRSLPWNAGQPDDLICQIGFSILSDEPMQTACEFRESEFFGENNAGMGTSPCLPLCGELKEISMVEADNGAAFVCGKRQLFIVGQAQISGIACGQAIDPMRMKQRGYRQMHVFIEIEFHWAHRAENTSDWSYGRESDSGAARCSAISRSMSSR